MRLTRELRQLSNQNLLSPTGLLAEFRTTPHKSFQQKYGIVLNGDGTVFDTRHKLCYDSLQNWASGLIETRRLHHETS